MMKILKDIHTTAYNSSRFRNGTFGLARVPSSAKLPFLQLTAEGLTSVRDRRDQLQAGEDVLHSSRTRAAPLKFGFTGRYYILYLYSSGIQLVSNLDLWTMELDYLLLVLLATVCSVLGE